MTSYSLYERCAAEYGDETTNILQCVSKEIETVTEKDFNADLTPWFLVIAGALVFFMQAGFAMLCSGSVRKKNVNNTLLKNLLDACGAAIAFYAVGYAFAFGETDSTGITFIGSSNFFMYNVDPATWFFQYAFSATAVTIVAGTLAERCQMAAYMCYSLVLSGIIYPVVVHAIWSSNGFLSTGAVDPIIGNGMVDFAGSAVVHMTGGSTALIATTLLGPRRGRFTDTKTGKPLRRPGLSKGHSTSLQLLGTFILWFGWYGFNPGSALLAGVEGTGEIAATAAVTTTLSAASGAISSLLTNAFIQGRKTGEYEFDIVMTMNGCLSGLVAITAGCAVVETWAAIIIGVIAGWIYLGTSSLLLKIKIDDAVDAIPVHLTNGLWGVIAVGLLASPDLLNAAYGNDEHVGFFYSFSSGVDATLLAVQVVGAVFVIAWTTVTMYPFFLVLSYMGWFRVDALEELVGLDATYKDADLHDESDTDEDERIAAYQERLRQKLEKREGKDMDEILNSAWGTASLSGDDRGSECQRTDESSGAMKRSPDQEKPEQAPPPRPSSVIINNSRLAL